ncbi:DEKNAAC103664 [Brettanomyces naardenensis]|uniref:DEKNAAC103664 n=1 Tax=Brettanomyces naardenensis TaxID=13370 RepID=A0A448YNF1_BRENA|nr:DEKNAAC103664 [Brettanomyces naardenensis]
MPQSVTVTYKFREFKTSLSASATLSQLLEQSCAYFHVSDSSSFELHYRNNEIDLSLPFRLANLPQGSKLTLVKSGSSGGASVTIKLQVIAPERDPTFEQPPPSKLVQKFRSTDGLFDVILKYESILETKLLDRTSYYDDTKIGKRVYCEYQPVVQNISGVIENAEDLKSTSLRSLGITKGNHSLRLQFRRVEVRAEDLEKVKKDEEVKAEEVKEEEARDPTEVKEVKEVNIQEPKEPEVPKKPKEHLTDNSQATVDPPSIPSTASLPSPAKVLPGLEVYSPKLTKRVSHQDPDDSVYDMTVEQARAYQALLSKRATNGPMMTRAQREKLNSSRSPVVTECIIRVRFPDLTTVQLILSASDTLKELYSTLVEQVIYLNDKERASLDGEEDPVFFELMTLHPQVKVLTSSKDFGKQLVSHCGLGRRSLLVYREKKPSDKDHYVREEYLANAKPLNDMGEIRLEEAMTTEPELKKSANEIARGLRPNGTKKVPKWFKFGKK